ncbi:hypothetical protein ACIB24_19215 [Spongisporangium articulatum]|uniref:Uncharacterized protein n=1 Tax=Spongisporangium articulatum TaxID=3362603 RepID=A0ABW8AS22_9ACTN
MAALSITVLTEEALSDADAQRLVQVHEGEDVAYHVIVPADVKRNLLADVLDHLSLFELREALDAVRGKDDDRLDKAEAAEALAASVAALTGTGAEATGDVVEGDPIAALRLEVADGADEVFVVTEPHAVEDTFHADWASKARDTLGVPVLHVYAGTGFLG